MSFLDSIPKDLQDKIKKITTILPNSLDIFKELYEVGVNQGNRQNDNEPVSKKRKVNTSESGDHSQDGEGNISQDNIIFKLNEVSVLSPLRKKLNFILHLSDVDKKPMLSLQKDKKIELSIHNLRSSIKMATFLPVSEKPNLMYLFIKYTTPVDSDDDTNKQKKTIDPILIALTKDQILHQFHNFGILDSTITDFNQCIDYMRKQAILTGFRISNPFTINMNGGDVVRSFFVNCHRGTKEGSLYFLPDNIIFGFRKPILVFDSTDIESITYSSITRLTFNVTLITKSDEKYEFSMIDQSEYTKIDEYVRRKQVIDKSMSEELKAKTKKNANENSEDGNGVSALEEATQQMNGTAAPDINGADFDSEDDEENDGNFEADSDLSDGSESENNDSEDLEANSDPEDQDVEEQEGGDEEIQGPEEEENGAITSTLQGYDNMNVDLSSNLSNIPIEIDDDEEDEDDDEGSGVEYD